MHLAHLKQSYLKQFPEGRFVVIHGKLSERMDHWGDRSSFVAALAAEGIEVWDLGRLPEGEWILPEGHPNQALHRLLAERIQAKLVTLEDRR